ncbi:MAG: hypothetical protein F4X11_12120 [Acidobacteria bacterium]|nr:hypothetical protein [Acidobacteriota bacterium]
MDPDVINSIGLALDIAGVVLLFRFGLPSDVVHPDRGDRLLLGGPTPEERQHRETRWNRHRFWSRLGLGLLVVGFALQAVSNHVGVPAAIILPAIPCPP